MNDLVAYGGLLVAAFLAATLLPAQSEALLAGLVIADRQPVLALLAVASLGNVAGSASNWLLGRWIEHYRDRRWFPVTPQALARAENAYRKWGHWSLLASWVPIIGDPLTLVAGVLREPFGRFLLIVSLAKIARYCVVIAFARQWV